MSSHAREPLGMPPGTLNARGEWWGLVKKNDGEWNEFNADAVSLFDHPQGLYFSGVMNPQGNASTITVQLAPDIQSGSYYWDAPNQNGVVRVDYYPSNHDRHIAQSGEIHLARILSPSRVFGALLFKTSRSDGTRYEVETEFLVIDSSASSPQFNSPLRERSRWAPAKKYP